VIVCLDTTASWGVSWERLWASPYLCLMKLLFFYLTGEEIDKLLTAAKMAA
jgi:hypothetical protein